ncbi:MULTISPECIES: glycosyltransferase family 4 protein [Methanothermobacter]|uniref:Glycosyltransferase family 4 protein n=1 Tax=Methanothermobacter wolfeii TaxID=145261 RepID=A0A9E7RUJ4_METWO|nr:glycosyltransferase family 4 protein [Methanothermobacter wolfeii]UXH32418.1 glycosyltransferase family 4 protein [Methanothermobacter wolfeii]
MKICIISSLYKPTIIGGAEVVAEKTARELQRRGHEVFVVTTNHHSKTEEVDVDDIKTYRIPLNIYSIYNLSDQSIIKKLLWHLIDLWNPSAYLKLKDILKEEKPDIIHIHNFKGFSGAAFSAAKKLDVPVVFTVHDYSVYCVRANLLKGDGSICTEPRIPCRFYKEVNSFFIDKIPDFVISPSKSLIDKLKSQGFFRDSEIAVIPNPVEKDPEIIEKDYITIDILYVGALSKHKGVDVLIRAFRELGDDNIRLHIVGRGPDENKLKALHGDDERIIFHGFLEGEELSGMYGKANVTVVPSVWYENSPMVVYESFAHSTPVIGSNIGGIPELVSEGCNGFLFEPGDKDELKSTLKRLVEDPSILKEFEKNAHESAKKYTIKEHLEKLERIYRGLL